MTIDVMFTRTNDGDYIAHFDCNESELPSSGVFFYVAIKADELALLRHRAAKLQAEATQYNSNAMRFESERNTAIDCAEDYKAIIAQMKAEHKAQIEQLRVELATVKAERDKAQGWIVSVIQHCDNDGHPQEGVTINLENARRYAGIAK